MNSDRLWDGVGVNYVDDTGVPRHVNCGMVLPTAEESIKLGRRFLMEHRLGKNGIAFHPCRQARVEYNKISACTHRWYGPLDSDNECKDCSVTYGRYWTMKMHLEREEEARRRAEGRSVAGLNPGMTLE